MALTIDLAPDVEAWLREEAARYGQDVAEYVKALVEERRRDAPTALVSLMALPLEERRRLIAQGAEVLEANYRDDLARPVEERELTAITARPSAATPETSGSGAADTRTGERQP